MRSESICSGACHSSTCSFYQTLVKANTLFHSLKKISFGNLKFYQKSGPLFGGNEKANTINFASTKKAL